MIDSATLSSSEVLNLSAVVATHGGHRMETVVGGTPVWFESPDVVLNPGIEAFVIAMLFPAFRQRMRLQTDVPVDATLLGGLAAMIPTYAEWWNVPTDTCELLMGDGATTGRPSAAAGLCFSGGVDSFYSLLTGHSRVDVLVLVHGFDIPLNDERRWHHAESSLRRVGAALGKRTVVIRTNLREHRLFKGVSWPCAHGAALAAAGHALASTIGSLQIPPTHRADRLRPWGSDPRTDPLYSSSRLRIEHPPSSDGRPMRIAKIVHDPLVRHHLRVCYENRTPFGNCSRCEKCVSTMTVLAGLGQLVDFECFDQSLPLSDCLDGLPYIADHLVETWQEIANMPQSEAVAEALQRLFQRRPPGRLARARHRLRRWWKKRCA